MQNEDGSFGSTDGVSSESCAQVIVALTALGINPDTDVRFVKNGNSVLDALCGFAVDGGGFMHIPGSNRDGMATEQGYYALVAYDRYLKGETALYDMVDVKLPEKEDDGEGEPVVLPFTDVEAGSWYEEYVRYVYANNIMKGMKLDVFGPDETLTRAMFITMIYRMEGEPAVSGSHGFSDIADDAYYKAAVTWGAKNGIVLGYNGKYNPDDKLTREQMAAIMYRYASVKGADMTVKADFIGFKDGNAVSDWAVENLRWAIGTGLLTGHANGNLDPQGNATRAQAAVVMQRYCETILK